MQTVFSVGSAPKLYDVDPRQAERILEGVTLDGSRR
jgi:hypothetical protein